MTREERILALVWLNAKIRLDAGTVLSDAYAHKCCKTAGIKSKVRHYKYKKSDEPGRASSAFPSYAVCMTTALLRIRPAMSRTTVGYSIQ